METPEWILKEMRELKENIDIACYISRYDNGMIPIKEGLIEVYQYYLNISMTLQDIKTGIDKWICLGSVAQ